MKKLYRTENSKSGSSEGPPNASACSISRRARSAAAFVSGAANPLTWNSEFMSATCSLISSRRSRGGQGRNLRKRARKLLCGFDERRAR